MSRIRFFTDEDVYGSVAPALRRAGIDAFSTPDAGRAGESDESQLLWSASQGRVLVTFNVAHFAAMHAAWLIAGRGHAGIAVSSQRPIGDVVRRLRRLADALDAQAMVNRLEYLSDW